MCTFKIRSVRSESLYKYSGQKESLFLEIMQFLKSVETEGILLTVYKQHQNAKESNPIEQFRDTTKYFLKLVENYKSEKSKQELQMQLFF